MFIKRMKPLATAAVAVALICTSPAIAWADCKMQPVMLLPITMSGTKPLVTVSLDGTVAHLMMDTGAVHSYVTPEAAKRAGLDIGAAPRNLRLSGIGGEHEAGLVTIKSFIVGGQTLHGARLLVYGDRFAGSGVDGILGQNILRLGDLEIDLANGMARLFKATGCDHANEAYWAGTAPVSVLRIEPTATQPQVVASAEVNGTDIHVLVDSGASFSLLRLRAAQKAGVTPQSPGAVPGGLVFGFGDAERDSWIAPFHSFKLDTEETHNTRLRIGDLGALAGNSDMLLGADFFLSHHILIAYGQRRIFFTYNGGPVFDLRVHEPATPVAPVADATSGSAPTASAADLDQRAEVCLARNDFPAAIADFNLAIGIEPDSPLYHLHRAAALARSGNAQQALTDLDEALRLQPNLTQALMLRASIRIRNDNLDGAQADFAAAETGDPARFELPLQEAGAYTAAERYPLALEVLDRWIAAHPRDERRSDALAERCLVRGMLGKDLDAALSDCNTARRNATGNSEILYDRGIVQLRRGQFSKAISDLTDAIALQPLLAPALYARGLARIAKGDKTAGATDLQAALAMQPQVAHRFRDIDPGALNFSGHL